MSPRENAYLMAGADPVAAMMVGQELARGEHNLARGEDWLRRGERELARGSSAEQSEIVGLHRSIARLEAVVHSMAGRGEHHRNKRTDAAVGFDSGATLVTPGSTVTILSTPVVPVLIDQLTIPSSIAGFLAIQEIRVGMKPFNAGSSVFSAASFSELAVIHLAMDIGLVAAGTQIQTTVLWLGAASARLIGTYLGRNLDNPCAPGEVYNANGWAWGQHQHGQHPFPSAPGLPFHHQAYPGHY